MATLSYEHIREMHQVHAVHAYLSSDDTGKSSGNWHKVGLDTDDLDVSGSLVTLSSTNKVEIGKDGLYLIEYQVTFDSHLDTDRLRAQVELNGSSIMEAQLDVGGTGMTSAGGGRLVKLSEDDELVLYAQDNNNSFDIVSDASRTFLSVFRLGTTS